MVNEILEHYLDGDEPDQRMIPLAVDAISPDYFLYLYAGHDDWFVVVEADYLFVKEIPRDIEASFPVKVEGWRTLLEHRNETSMKLLPPYIFRNESVNESDDDWRHYHGVVYQDGLKYALIEVKPNQGVGIKEFGLTYYER